MTESQLMVFVIGPIGDRLGEVGSRDRERYERAIQTFENIIEPACELVGLDRPIRADKVTRPGEITEQVFRYLRDADIVIADLTDANPNVMYELGLRHTRDVLTVQIGENERLPFDVSTIRTIRFRRSEGGFVDARNDLVEALEEALAHGFDPVPATRIWNEAEPVSPETDLSAPVPDDAEEPGWLELLADMEEAMPEVNETLREIPPVMHQMKEVAERGKRELDANERAGGGARGRLTTAIRFAERLEAPIDQLDEIAKQYKAQMERVQPGLDYLLEHVASEQLDDDELSEANEALDSIIGMGSASSDAMDAVRSFRDITDGLSGMARPVRQRTDRLVRVLDDMIATSAAFGDWTARAEEAKNQLRDS